MPESASSCPACGYHLRLGTRLSLSEAVRDASAERKVAIGRTGRTGTKDERAAHDRKVARRAMRLLYGAALALAAAAVLYLGLHYRQGIAGRPLDRLRADFRNEMRGHFAGEERPLAHEAAFSPFCAGLEFEINVPAREIAWENPPWQTLSADSGPESFWSRVAETGRLPYFRPDRRGNTDASYANSLLPRALALCEGLSARFSPTASGGGARLLRGDGRIPVWRRNRQPTQSGHLAGALVDLGPQDTPAMEARLAERADQDGDVVLRGILTFVFSRKGDLAGQYGRALDGGLDRLLADDAGAAAPSTPATPAPRGPWRRYAHPVLVVAEGGVFFP